MSRPRIAFIGAGSFTFTQRLVRDVQLVPELRDAHFALHDIDHEGLDRITQILQKDISVNGLPATVSAHTDRRAALEGAHYAASCVRIGGVEAFRSDVQIPLRYGVDQCVGDTLCAGGILYGQRNVPQILAFQKDLKEVAADGCLFLNYANPMAINTWAALDAFDRGEGVDVVGLCHGVQHGHHQIDGALAHLHGDPSPDDDGFASYDDRTRIVCAGINHQTWYTTVIYKGRRVATPELIQAFENHPEESRSERVRIDVMRRFGLYSTESNGHLSEYLPWYRKRFADRPREADKWVRLDRSWIDGETGGYLRKTEESRHSFEQDFQSHLDKAGEPFDQWKRSEEHASRIIEARETGRPYRGHFNRRNNGVIPQLPPDCVIEAPGTVTNLGFEMAAGLALPQACAATCIASVNVQRMAKDAAVAGDVTLLKQSVLHDPLTAAVCDPEEVWQMVDEMLVAQRRWLPNYAPADLDAAAGRLRDHVGNGTRVAARDFHGAARNTPAGPA